MHAVPMIGCLLVETAHSLLSALPAMDDFLALHPIIQAEREPNRPFENVPSPLHAPIDNEIYGEALSHCRGFVARGNRRYVLPSPRPFLQIKVLPEQAKSWRWSITFKHIGEAHNGETVGALQVSNEAGVGPQVIGIFTHFTL